MPSGFYLGFDFGYKRIGVAVGQQLTCSASPLATIQAQAGVPDWNMIAKVIHETGHRCRITIGAYTCNFFLQRCDKETLTFSSIEVATRTTVT